MREFLRDWVPHGLARAARARWPRDAGLKGPYASWAEARLKSDGYESALILEAVDRATARALTDNQVSQDGVVLTDAPLPFPLVACLLYTAALKGRAIHVIDFGGGLGSVWHRCQGLLHTGVASWSVVEQPHFVARGREKYQTAQLQFFESMTEAAAWHPPDAILFSSVLQYIENPFRILAEAACLKPMAILVDRTPYGDSRRDVILVQKVSPKIYAASYPLYIFGVGSIEDGLRPDYRRVLGFDASDGVWPYDGGTAHFRGEFYLRSEDELRGY